MNWKIRFVTPRSSFFPGSVYDEYDFYFSTDHHNHHNRFQTKPEHAWKEDLGIRLTPGGGGGYSHTLPIRVCAAQRGRDFEAPDLERGIHFRGSF